MVIYFLRQEVAMARFDLSDAEWRLIEPLLPNKPRGVARVDDRRVLNGIFYVLRTGSPWRDLPERYGPYTTVYNRYNGGPRPGSGCGSSRPWRQVAAVHGADRQFDHPGPPARRRRKKGGPDHAIGRSRGGLSTKINAVVDENGLPVRLVLTAGQASDMRAVPQLLAEPAGAAMSSPTAATMPTPSLDLIRAAGAEPTSQRQRDRKVQRSVNRRIYRQRNLVERFFNKLKHFRRIATRFDKLARNFLAAVALASTRLWTRAYESTT